MDNSMVLTKDIEIRFRDLDAMGHVNNAVIFTYFEEGRKCLFQEIQKSADPVAFNFIIAFAGCEYLKPIGMNDKLSLQVRVTEIGTKSFKLRYNIVDSEDDSISYSTGDSVQVCYDYKENASVEVSAELREKLMRYYKP